jgi:hypothetical protein
VLIPGGGYMFHRCISYKAPGTRFKARNCINEPCLQDPYRDIFKSREKLVPYFTNIVQGSWGPGSKQEISLMNLVSRILTIIQGNF